jgi:hypothetical protein
VTNTRATTSGCANDGSKLLIFISKRTSTSEVRFHVLLEKEIRFVGNDAASKQWRGKLSVRVVQVMLKQLRDSNVSTAVATQKCAAPAGNIQILLVPVANIPSWGSKVPDWEPTYV